MIKTIKKIHGDGETTKLIDKYKIMSKQKNSKEAPNNSELHTVLCAAFCGTGKSYLCSNFANDYMELECWEYRKGDFPNNYVKDVISAMGETKYLLISTDPVILKELNKRCIEIQLYYPENKLRNEYLDRFIARDSPQDFVGAIMINWHRWVNELKEQNYCKHTILQTGEYLQNVL